MEKQWSPVWGSLPEEIRLLILKLLEQDGCTLGRMATVPREWQTELERYNFAGVRLTPSRLVDFSSMIHRNRALVKYIWLCLELDDYDCTRCQPTSTTSTQEQLFEAIDVTDTDHCPITTTFHSLFSALSTWEPREGGLTLDISIYSPSDAQHWFKYLTFVPDSPYVVICGNTTLGGEQTLSSNEESHHDPPHGWVDGIRQFDPPEPAMRKIFHSVMEDGPFDSEQLEFQWWDQLPSVPAVTTLLLRQQNRRRWLPSSLAHMFARFPKLQEVHYEPWREWHRFLQRGKDQREFAI